MGIWDKLFNAQPARNALDESDIDIPNFAGKLRGYQAAGVRYMSSRKRVLLADEMGLGKTIQTLATVEHNKAFPCIVISPASLKLNWAEEAHKWLPARKAQVLQGTSPYDIDADIIILNYDIAYYWHRKLIELRAKSLVLDEAHYIKNPKAQRTGSVKHLASMIDIRLLLTGTPILNRPDELVALLSMLDQMKALGGFWWFSHQYCNGGSFKTINIHNMTKLNATLRQSCYLRREKKDVLKELPAKQRTIIHLELSNLEDYNRKVKEILRHSKDENFSLLGGLEQLRLMVGLGKLQGVQNWVETFLSTGSKLVLFAEHVEVQRKLLALWPNSAHILGEDSAEVRNQQVHRFQTDPNCQLIICSLKAAGVGLTLTAASNVAFVELGWNSAEHDQAEDRVHRIGQTQPVNCWYLLAPKTVDEYAYSMIEGKRSMASAATAGQVDSPPAPAADTLLALLQSQAA